MGHTLEELGFIKKTDNEEVRVFEKRGYGFSTDVIVFYKNEKKYVFYDDFDENRIIEIDAELHHAIWLEMKGLGWI